MTMTLTENLPHYPNSIVEIIWAADTENEVQMASVG